MISIHAPAKGATGRVDLIYDVIYISIHAPAKGATRVSKCPLLCIFYFNPRTREGCDFG